MLSFFLDSPLNNNNNNNNNNLLAEAHYLQQASERDQLGRPYPRVPYSLSLPLIPPCKSPDLFPRGSLPLIYSSLPRQYSRRTLPGRVDSQPISAVSLATAGTEDEKTDALRLIAASVLEQRFIAIRSLFLHPVVLCLALLAHAIAARLLFRKPYNTVLGAFGYTVCILSAVFALTYVSREYAYLATQSETRAWLIQPHRARHPPSSNNSSSKSLPEDDILVAKYDSRVVGALVFRIARTRAFMTGTPSATGFTRGHRRRSSHSSSARLTGVIRAWTVKTSYRHRGIGTDLLRQAVEMCRRRRLDGPVFADDHAYSVRVLPRMFGRAFERRDTRARDLLTDVIEEEC
ncbi:hypothetical protein DTO282E5_8702 [Paecilomyces variotii]|nr:hypothetical protein DTO282E5_8702 [Paecilomyces variotii]